MKVYNLRCKLNHVFEGWFASEAEFVRQQSSGWLSCPMCASTDVVKGVSAPHLARKSNAVSHAGSTALQGTQPPGRGKASTAPDTTRVLQQAWLALSHHIAAHTEDVGPAFAQVARQIHDGEAAERPIRGNATADECRALAEDGIEVIPLLLPESTNHRLQ